MAGSKRWGRSGGGEGLGMVGSRGWWGLGVVGSRGGGGDRSLRGRGLGVVGVIGVMRDGGRD